MLAFYAVKLKELQAEVDDLTRAGRSDAAADGPKFLPAAPVQERLRVDQRLSATRVRGCTRLTMPCSFRFGGALAQKVASHRHVASTSD